MNLSKTLIATMTLLIILTNQSYAEDSLSKIDRLSKEIASIRLWQEDCTHMYSEAAKAGGYIRKLQHNLESYISCNGESEQVSTPDTMLSVIRDERFKDHPELTLGEIRENCSVKLSDLKQKAEQTLKTKEKECERDDWGI